MVFCGYGTVRKGKEKKGKVGLYGFHWVSMRLLYTIMALLDLLCCAMLSSVYTIHGTLLALLWYAMLHVHYQTSASN